MDPALLEVHTHTIEALYKELRPLYQHYADKVGERKGFFGKAAYLGVLGLYHEIQAANLDRHHRWPMPWHRGPEHRRRRRQRGHPLVRAEGAARESS